MNTPKLSVEDIVRELGDMECLGYTCRCETPEQHFVIGKDWLRTRLNDLLESAAGEMEMKVKGGGVCAFDLNGPLCPDCNAVRIYNAASHDAASLLRSKKSPYQSNDTK